MEWPMTNGVPVVLDATRPGRGRHRLYSEHPNRQPVYYQDPNGFLVPAAPAPPAPLAVPVHHHRAASVSTPHPPNVIINNTTRDDHSPVRGHHHRRSSHGHEYAYEDDSDYDDHRYISPPRGRRAHSHVRTHSRSPSPCYDRELMLRMEKLDKLEKEEEEKAQRERFAEQEILKAEKKKKKEKEEEEMKKKWVEEFKLKEEEEKKKKEKKKKEEEEAHHEWALRAFAKKGYSEESVEKILKDKPKEEKKEKEKAHKHVHLHGTQVMDLTRPTYIKVNKKYLAPETLDAFALPWEWDTRDATYIIIKQWVPEFEQEILFEHSRKLRERKQLEYSTVELRKEKGKLQLVEKKSHSPGRARSKSRGRSWIFT